MQPLISEGMRAQVADDITTVSHVREIPKQHFSFETTNGVTRNNY